MKYLFLLTLVFIATAYAAWAQDLAVTPGAPLGVTDQLSLHLIEMAVFHPWILTVLGLVGLLRLVFKPTMALLHWHVKGTPSPDDDRLLEQVEKSPAFGLFSWLLDLTASIKVDAIRQAAAKRSAGSSTLAPVIAVLLLAGFFIPGCATAGGEKPLTADRIQRISRLAVWTTTVGLISAKPEREGAFRKAQAALDKLIAESNWDIQAVTVALASSGEETFTGSEGRLILAGTTLLIDTVAGQTVDLKNQEKARAVLLGAQEGLLLALPQPVTEQRPVIPPPPPAVTETVRTNP